eukprot:jgi/Undpi1/5975/HiC_scaffold_2.g01249.m1
MTVALTVSSTVAPTVTLIATLTATFVVSEEFTTGRDGTLVAPEEKSGQPEYCTVYIHMGSCGRSLSTSSVIASAFGELLRIPLMELGRECDYFTMVRHPIDRLVSAFFYCPTDHDLGRSPSKWCGGTQEESTAKPLLMEYAKTHWQNMALNQMVLSTLCPQRFAAFCSENQKIGRAPGDMTSPQGLDAIEAAQAVGIFEHFELSMELFDATVVSPVRQWDAGTQSNPGKQSDVRQRLLDWAHLNTELRRYLAPDLMIYDLAVAVFKQQTAAALGTEW